MVSLLKQTDGTTESIPHETARGSKSFVGASKRTGRGKVIPRWRGRGCYRSEPVCSHFHQEKAAQRKAAGNARSLSLRLRPHIERIIAGVVRYNDARITRRVGLANANFQVKMARVPSGRAYNLKHWLVLILQREKAQRVQVASP